MRLNRLVLAWNGAQVVGGGVTVWHFEGAEGAVPDVAAIKAAVTAIAPSIPVGVTITVPNSGDVIEDTTGELVDVWTGSGGGVVSGTATTPAPAGVGLCINWLTGGIVNGRRLRGRTFMVPIAGNSYDPDGTLTASTLTDFAAFASAIVASGGLAVWHRPTAPGLSDGNSYGVLSVRLRDKVAVLTSRRD